MKYLNLSTKQKIKIQVWKMETNKCILFIKVIIEKWGNGYETWNVKHVGFFCFFLIKNIYFEYIVCQCKIFVSNIRWSFISSFILALLQWVRLRVMMFNLTFNNISVISSQSVLLVEETRVPVGKPQTCYKALTNFVIT